MSNLSLYSIINFRDTAYPVLESDFIKSIQSGCDINATFPKSIQDNTGDHISSKNALYGELTAHYWVWKNAPKTDFIGFCHYRRFFELKKRFLWFKKRHHYPHITHEELTQKWETHYSRADLFLNHLKKTDIILPKPMVFRQTIAEQYNGCHGDFSWFVGHFYKTYPDLKHRFDQYFFETKVFYPTLLFVTRYDHFNEFMNWLFHFLFSLDEQAVTENRSLNERDFAFIAERLFGFYFHYVKSYNVCIKNLAILVMEPSSL